MQEHAGHQCPLCKGDPWAEMFAVYGSGDDAFAYPPECYLAEEYVDRRRPPLPAMRHARRQEPSHGPGFFRLDRKISRSLPAQATATRSAKADSLA
jgi:hypothetical protein